MIGRREVNVDTLTTTAVPAPETASNPTARIAWDQWNLNSVAAPTEEMAAVGAAAAGCRVCTGACGWMLDDDFTCPSVSIMKYYTLTLVI
jgi:hypothetical protein